jgi:carboxypeptidase PM20D1
MFKKILSFIIFLAVFSAAYLLLNALNFSSRQLNYKAVEKIKINDSAIHHLSKAINIKTISPEHSVDFDSTQFEQFSDFLSTTYTQVEKKLTKKTINKFSYLYKWQGTDEQLKPAILVAHSDVVPIPGEDLNEWTVPPFSGEIKDGILWGRGTMDDKVGVIGILEAVEHLLKEEFTPQRTVYLAFGHDKEIGGINGAQSIVNYLKQEGVHADFVLDEGFSITRGLVPGVLTDLALIGIAEKGFASLSLSVKIDGGPSSTPNSETEIKVLANAITKLENKPFPAEFTLPVQLFLEYVGPEMRFQEKLVFANSKLFRSVILGNYQQTNTGRAVVQTTMVPTLFNSGIKEKVIPSMASATINFRILPGLTIEQLISDVTATIDDDRIKISLTGLHSEASKVSSTSSASYAILNKSIKEVFPKLLTAPNLLIRTTDGRYYEEISENVYRFLPIHLNPYNVKAIHGIDENIAVNEFEDAIRFYIQLIKNCNK